MKHRRWAYKQKQVSDKKDYNLQRECCGVVFRMIRSARTFWLAFLVIRQRIAKIRYSVLEQVVVSRVKWTEKRLFPGKP
ncbi:hypothetical protein BK132_03065 [Paenibacillus sp. FSL H8-0259]|nr:hypothetical protein BK132_03065 [Paenibacillus sp. FSL H8-0259]